MQIDDAVELGRNALLLTLLLASPMLAVALITGLVVGLLQTLTQVQEQTISLVPKIVAVLIVGIVSLPWLLMQMVHYMQQVVGNIPDYL